MSGLEWYKDVLSKIKPADLSNSRFPDKMDLWIEEKGNVIKTWVSQS
jgi:hypothetical protein